jgi:epoxide hydrolase-like predicted phosphatase
MKVFMTIKTILFDFGGVLYKMPDPKGIDKWTGLLGIEKTPELIEMLSNSHESELVKDICLGKISEEQAWGMIQSKWSINSGSIGRIRRNFLSKRSLNRQMVRFMAALKDDYQLGILSNAGDQARSLMTDVLNLDSYVDEIIISAEEGVMKPDAKIYKIAMDRLDTKPDQTLFIDDYFNNVQAAEHLGMKAVHFSENQKAIGKIREILQEDR